MTRPAREPIRILPPKFVPMSEEEFDEVTDLLAELILEKLRENRPDRQRDF